MGGTPKPPLKGRMRCVTQDRLSLGERGAFGTKWGSVERGYGIGCARFVWAVMG